MGHGQTVRHYLDHALLVGRAPGLEKDRRVQIHTLPLPGWMTLADDLLGLVFSLQIWIHNSTHCAGNVLVS